jgi:hypothetical protein
MNWFEQDYAEILFYDNSTGLVYLDRSLSQYHWGSLVSTAADYSGVDMRGEVMLLSRNIKIVGNDSEAWGGQVLTGDFIESNGQLRTGRTFLDNVEIYNCSQYDTYKAALRFDSATNGTSVVSNSSIHHGLGIGVEIADSANVILDGNNIWDFVKFGVNIVTVQNITVNNN